MANKRTRDEIEDDDDDELDDDELELDDDEENPLDPRAKKLIQRLRKEVKTTKKEAKSLKKVNEELTEKNRKALLDSSNLNPDLTERQRNALLRELESEEGELTPEVINKVAVELNMAEPLQEQEDLVQSAEDRIDRASQGAKATTGGVIKPEQVNEWPMDKRLRFQEQHPDKFEAILRGEDVVVPDFAA